MSNSIPEWVEVDAEPMRPLHLQVNGAGYDLEVPDRRLLHDALRQDCSLTGTHAGCEHGVCGACTVLVDGAPTRSCLMFARSAEGHRITTVEGLGSEQDMSPIQQAFTECHGLQCGFCTPGFLTTLQAYIDQNPEPTEAEAREAASGNLCRCTGYEGIVKAVQRGAEIAAERRAQASPAPQTSPTSQEDAQ